MKTILLIAVFGIILCVEPGRAQSTTGGGSGGSTASTGASYSTSDRRPSETSAQSMTVADEGASRGYILGPRVDPDRPAGNCAKSPDGDPSASGGKSARKQPTSGQKSRPATGTKRSGSSAAPKVAPNQLTQLCRPYSREVAGS